MICTVSAIEQNGTLRHQLVSAVEWSIRASARIGVCGRSLAWYDFVEGGMNAHVITDFACGQTNERRQLNPLKVKRIQFRQALRLSPV